MSITVNCCQKTMTREASLVPAERSAGAHERSQKSENIRRKSHEQTNRTNPMDTEKAIEPAHGAHHDAEFAANSSAGNG